MGSFGSGVERKTSENTSQPKVRCAIDANIFVRLRPFQVSQSNTFPATPGFYGSSPAIGRISIVLLLLRMVVLWLKVVFLLAMPTLVAMLGQLGLVNLNPRHFRCFPSQQRSRFLHGEKVTAKGLLASGSSSIAGTGDRHRQQRENKYEQLMKASTLSLAPMMDYTDRHFRHLVRLISSQMLCYTEMVAANTLVYERAGSINAYQDQHPDATESAAAENYSDAHLPRYLGQSGIRVPPAEGASVLQLGGSDPQHLFEAAETVMQMTDRGHCDYTALNLNTGCPSPKVAGKGCFGAALMDNPALVSELVSAMHDGCKGRLPITVKCRIGTDTSEAFYKLKYAQIDETKEYARLCDFIEAVASSGVVSDFSVHARIAVLSRSFSPSDNRKIPPLKYKYIRKLVEDYPGFTFSLNGGITNLAQVQEELEACPGLKGVMVGRALAADPWSFAMADQLLYNGKDRAEKNDMRVPQNRLEVLKEYGKYADEEEARGDPSKIRRFIVKAITPLFAGEPRSKRYRIALDKIAGLPKKGCLEGQPPISELIINCAMENLPEDVLLRSREESYERAMSMHEDKIHSEGTYSPPVVEEWQERRKSASDGSYDQMLATGGQQDNEVMRIAQANQNAAAV